MALRAASGQPAVQIAKAAGARHRYRIGQQRRIPKSIGVDQVVDYQAQKFEDVVKNVDLVLNTANAETTARSISVVREGGCS
jgi:NADPH:quinone reductase-like Zn-dependent oxidoreductase